MSEVKQHQWVAGIPGKTKSAWEVVPFTPYQAPICKYTCSVCGKALESKALVLLNQLPEISEPCPGLPCVGCNGRGTISEDNPRVCVICHGDGRLKSITPT